MEEGVGSRQKIKRLDRSRDVRYSTRVRYSRRTSRFITRLILEMEGFLRRSRLSVLIFLILICVRERKRKIGLKEMTHATKVDNGRKVPLLIWQMGVMGR